jgi:hypothetical protein
MKGITDAKHGILRTPVLHRTYHDISSPKKRCTMIYEYHGIEKRKQHMTLPSDTNSKTKSKATTNCVPMVIRPHDITTCSISS